MFAAPDRITLDRITPDRTHIPATLSSQSTRTLLLDASTLDGRSLVVGERGYVLESADAGVTWQQLVTPSSVTLTGVSQQHGGEAWAVGHSGVILHRSGAGADWTLQLSGEQLKTLRTNELKSVIALRERALPAAAEQDQDLLAEELDNMRFSLEDLQANPQAGVNSSLLSVLFADNRKGWAVGAYGVFLSTHDGGEHWVSEALSLDNPDGFHLNALARSADGSVYIVGEAGLIFRSLDDGDSWQRLDSPYDGSFFGLLPLRRPGELLVFGLRGRAFHSTDHGDSWQIVDSATRLTLSDGAILDDGALVLVGLGGVISRASNINEPFVARVQASRNGYSAMVALDDTLILVGESGVTRLTAEQWQSGSSHGN